MVAVEEEYFESATTYILTLTELDAARYILLSRTGRLLEVLEMPYTHSGVLASAMAMDKERTKQIVQGVGVPVARGLIVTPEAALADHVM